VRTTMMKDSWFQDVMYKTRRTYRTYRNDQVPKIHAQDGDNLSVGSVGISAGIENTYRHFDKNRAQKLNTVGSVGSAGILRNTISGGNNTTDSTTTTTIQTQTRKQKIEALYWSGSRWHCKNCNQSGDRFYMVWHRCKLSKIKSSGVVKSSIGTGTRIDLNPSLGLNSNDNSSNNKGIGN
jgi:hypothetical protein